MELIGTPVAHVEGWIGHHEVGFQCGMTVVEEGVGVAVAQVGLNATDGEVHHGHLAGVGVDFLTENAEILDVTLMVANEVGTLDKHATTSHGWIVTAAFVWLQHRHNSADNAAGCVEFACVLAFQRGELGEAVFVGTTQKVFVLFLFAQLDGVGEQVDDIAETTLVKLGTSEVFRQDAFETVVLFLDLHHGVVDDLANLWGVGGFGDDAPACIGGHIKDVFGHVFVLIFFEAVAFIDQLLVFHVETIGNVFQEDEA